MRLLFENFVLDVARRELRRDDQPVRVEPQVFDLLVYLVLNRSHVVSKDELFTAIWQGRVVSEAALTTRLNAARTAVGDTGKAQRLIRTLRRSGIRFVGEVREEHPARFADMLVSRDVGDDARQAIPSHALPDQPSLAVLPFTSFGAHGEYDYFADGIVEDITTALAKWRWFLVIDRNTTFTYKDKNASARAIGEELGVRYLLGGSIRLLDRRLRISAHLIEAATGTQVWADRLIAC